MNGLKYLYNPTKSRSMLASLGLTLDPEKVSDEGFTDEQLNNKEVKVLSNGGYIKIVTAEEAEKILNAPPPTALTPIYQNTSTSEEEISGGMFEDGRPTGNSKMTQLIANIERSLNELKQLVQAAGSDTSTAEHATPEDQSLGTVPAGERKEDSPIPTTPPPGMQPSQTCSDFIKKPYVEKMRFLQTCKDVGLTREIIMFEPSTKIKSMAQTRVKQIEQEISHAANIRI